MGTDGQNIVLLGGFIPSIVHIIWQVVLEEWILLNRNGAMMKALTAGAISKTLMNCTSKIHHDNKNAVGFAAVGCASLAASSLIWPCVIGVGGWYVSSPALP